MYEVRVLYTSAEVCIRYFTKLTCLGIKSGQDGRSAFWLRHMQLGIVPQVSLISFED